MKTLPRARAPLRILTLALALLTLAVVVLVLRERHARTRLTATPAPHMQGEPGTMLWAWETPEDLRTLDTSRTGVAFLAREIALGGRVIVRSRRQPLLVADGTWLMAVVRLDATSTFAPSATLREQTAAAILDALARPGIQALQVDFDATATQRDFYAAVLRDVRGSLPAGMPLSITALVSWCGDDSWLTSLPSGRLPIDEAVPMFFRMGGPADVRASRPRSSTGVRARVCAGSAGVAMDEAWPSLEKGQRVYLFRSGPWTQEEIATLNRFGYVGLHENSP